MSKYIRCDNCKDVYLLIGTTRKCLCGKTAGKYLNDGLNAVITKNEYTDIFGLDNNTFKTAVERKKWVNENHPEWQRVDFFFTGWFPTKPGEVIEVETVKEVEDFDPDFEMENTSYSTMPNGDNSSET